MIARLEGQLIEKAAGRIVVDIQGVGYEVWIPFSTYYQLGELGDTVSLQIYTHVKEDAFTLYGFVTRKEKALFTRLIQVSGIGPKLGITILSGLPADDFIQAVTDGDVVKLHSIPGVGKKTAERLVLEIGDKVAELVPELEGGPGGPVTSIQQDVISALVNLGYPRKTAERAASAAANQGSEESFEELLRGSLRKIRA